MGGAENFSQTTMIHLLESKLIVFMILIISKLYYCAKVMSSFFFFYKYFASKQIVSFWRSFKVYLWTLADFSLIFSPVFVPNFFQRNILFFVKIHNTDLWVKHKAPNLRNESLLCVHVTDNDKEKYFCTNNVIPKKLLTQNMANLVMLCSVSLNNLGKLEKWRTKEVDPSAAHWKLIRNEWKCICRETILKERKWW